MAMPQAAPGSGLLGENKPTDDDVIIPFSDFAACRILAVRADEAVLTPVYQDLKRIAADFLKADLASLQKSTHSQRLYQAFQEDARRELDAPCGCGKLALAKQADSCMDVLTDNLEALLYEYLSNAWERVDAVVALNALDLRDLTESQQVDDKVVLGTSPSFSLLDNLPPDWGSSLSSHDSFDSSYGPVSFEAPVDPTRKFRAAVRRYSRTNLHSEDVRRGLANWQRARQAVFKYLNSKHIKRCTKNMNKLRTMQEIFRSVSAKGQTRPADHQPLLLLLGGGMAAGKSTVRELIGQSEFWSKMGSDAVVVEADALKSLDAIRRNASKVCGSHLSGWTTCVDTFVHEYSTRAAEALLLRAINEQKDVVFDGTHVWAPFIEQTIAMVRDHERDYCQGPGYVREPDGSVTELYWLPEGPTCNGKCGTTQGKKRPYRIEFVGVTCHPGLAVARGIWRRLRTGRGVPITAQLRSHNLFAQNFERFSQLVDSATLYHTGNHLTMFNKPPGATAPKAIAHSSAATLGDMLINPAPWRDFNMLKEMHMKATCAADLFVDTSVKLEAPLRPGVMPGAMAHALCVLRSAHRRDADLLEPEAELQLLHARTLLRGQELPEGMLRDLESMQGPQHEEEGELEEHWSFGR